MASLVYPPGANSLDALVWEDSFYATKEEDAGFNPFSVTTPDNVKEKLTAEEMQEVAGIGLPSSLALTDLVTKSDAAKKMLEDAIARGSGQNEATLLQQAALASACYINTFDHEQLKKFYTEALSIMKNTKTTANKDFVNMIRVFNYTALTMLRAVVKNPAQVISAFAKAQYARNVATMIPGEFSKLYAPPTKECIDRMVLYIVKTDPVVSSFMAKIVDRWSICTTEERGLAAIFLATVLTHTAWNGMGILEMVFEVSIEYGVKWRQIMEVSSITETENSWDLIYEFFVTYQMIGRIDKTVGWARVIDDAYFTEFAIARHRNLAALLMESIKDIQGSDGITLAVWAQKAADAIAYFRNGSSYLRKKLKGMGTKSKGTFKEGNDLAEKVHLQTVDEEALGSPENPDSKPVPPGHYTCKHVTYP